MFLGYRRDYAVAEKLHDAIGKIGYLSKFTEASRGSLCDSTALVSIYQCLMLSFFSVNNFFLIF